MNHFGRGRALANVPACSHTGVAYVLFQQFMEEVDATNERGGWNALAEYLLQYFRKTVTDELTGHLNRDAFFEVLEKVVIPSMRSRSAQYGASYGSLIVLDIDKFKKINSAFGHAGGDMVLKIFGELVGENFRDRDVVGRVGGDEFIVITESLFAGEVEERMSALQTAFNHYTMRLDRIDDEKSEVSLSFSYHIVNIDDPGRIPELIREADRAVFKQKRKRDADE